MTRAVTTTPVLPRGSAEGADGIIYPCHEDPTVSITTRANLCMRYVQMSLEQIFADRADVFVSGDQFVYWEPGNIHKRLAPDVYVLFGVPKDPPREVIRIWEEAPLAFVAEISSRFSRREDRGRKFAMYRDVLQVPEYLIYDEQRDDLALHRLVNGSYLAQEPDEDGRLHSRQLGVSFGKDPERWLRVYGPDGCPQPWSDELARRVEAERLAANEASRRAEEERRRAEEERRRADLVERRAEALEAELERLRKRLNLPSE
jgi:Uma2 family endonuclease